MSKNKEIDEKNKFSLGYSRIQERLFDFKPSKLGIRPYRSGSMKESTYPKSVVPAYGADDGGYHTDIGITYERSWSKLSEMEELYFDDPIINAAINIIAASVIDDGWILTGGKKKYIEYIDLFLENMKINEAIQNIVRNMLVYGEAFMEIVYRDKVDNTIGTPNPSDRFTKEVAGIRIINPKNMAIVRDLFGNYVSYEGKKTAFVQMINNIARNFGYTFKSDADIRKLTEHAQKGHVSFEPQEMIHFKFAELGDAGYGLSRLYSLSTVSYQRRQLEVDAVQLNHFFAHPILMFMLGDEISNMPASQADIDAFTDKLNEKAPDEHLITTHYAKAEVLGAYEKALDPVPYIEFLREHISLALGVPATLLGASSKGAFGGGVVQAQERVFHQLVSSLQESVKNGLRSKLFPLICYHRDRDKRTSDIEKVQTSSENEVMFDLDFMKDVPKMKFNPIESVLDRHKRVTEQFGNNVIPRKVAQRLANIDAYEIEEDDKYFNELEADEEIRVQTKLLDVEHKQAMELAKLEAKLMPKPTSPTSSASKIAKPKGKSGSRTDSSTTSTKPSKKTDGAGPKKVKQVSRKPKSEQREDT